MPDYFPLRLLRYDIVSYDTNKGVEDQHLGQRVWFSGGVVGCQLLAPGGCRSHRPWGYRPHSSAVGGCRPHSSGWFCSPHSPVVAVHVWPSTSFVRCGCPTTFATSVLCLALAYFPLRSSLPVFLNSHSTSFEPHSDKQSPNNQPIGILLLLVPATFYLSL